MSRSRRRTPIMPLTIAETDKPFKQMAARRCRHVNKQHLSSGDKNYIDSNVLTPNMWWSDKDGRQRVDPNSRWMRK